MTFGVQSLLLLIGIVQGLVFAGLLLSRRRNRTANRLLAVLLVLFVVSLTPSAIGFAGAYDRFPWLMFAPFSVTLGFGPVLWLYIRRLLTGRLPRWWGLHMVPLLLQFGYFSWLFMQPLQWRYEFNSAVHMRFVSPAEALTSVVSAIGYWFAALLLSRRYQRWAPQHVSDSENHGVGWLRVFLVGTAVGFGVWTGFEIVDEAILSLSYRMFFWLDLIAAVLVYGLAIAGYRRADHAWPAMPPAGPTARTNAEDVHGKPSPPAGMGPAAAEPLPDEGGRDWTSRASEYRVRIEEERLYLDPGLTLETLARELATNTWALSRAINEGAGCNFNDFVNAFRIAAVQEHLRHPNESRTLLEIAMASGFNSKTSFNRTFRKMVGMTPSEYRRRQEPGARS